MSTQRFTTLYMKIYQIIGKSLFHLPTCCWTKHRKRVLNVFVVIFPLRHTFPSTECKAFLLILTHIPHIKRLKTCVDYNSLAEKFDNVESIYGSTTLYSKPITSARGGMYPWAKWIIHCWYRREYSFCTTHIFMDSRSVVLKKPIIVCMEYSIFRYFKAV